MLTNRNYYQFAARWQKIFQQERGLRFEMDYLLQECEKMGFSLEVGNEFAQKYEAAGADVAALREILPQIQDINELGSALYAKCSFFKLWNPGEQVDQQIVDWCTAILDRLVKLSAATLKIFHGKISEMRLTTGKIGGLKLLTPGMETSQQLSLNRDGNGIYRVFAINDKLVEQGKSIQKIKCQPDFVEHFMYELAYYFKNGHEDKIDPNSPLWQLELQNDAGEKFVFHGLINDENEKLNQLTIDLRAMTGLLKFDAWDGQGLPDRVERLVFEYDYQIKETEIYHEELELERETGTLICSRQGPDGSEIVHSYRIPEKIDMLLNIFRSENDLDPRKIIFDDPRPENFLDWEDGKLTLYYEDHEPQIYQGVPDKEHMPLSWWAFLDKVEDLFLDYSHLGFLNGRNFFIYRESSELITICEVLLLNEQRSTYYLTNDRSLQAGEFVWVATGNDFQQTPGQVLSISSFGLDELPLPLDTMKKLTYVLGRIREK